MEEKKYSLKCGIVIPTYRHVHALPGILNFLSEADIPVILVDDGNTPEIADTITRLAETYANVHLEQRTTNGGKGRAVKDGFQAAEQLGWTHALQMDADGQHDLNAVQPMLQLVSDYPDCVICAVPRYDETVPKARRIGREITHFWVRLETMGNEISDSMCGLRAYPLEDALSVMSREFIGNRMDFDTEIIVQLNWRGLRTIEYPVNVTYPEENISNFRMLSDNVRISLMHTRLFLQAPFRVAVRSFRRACLPRYRQPSLPKS